MKILNYNLRNLLQFCQNGWLTKQSNNKVIQFHQYHRFNAFRIDQFNEMDVQIKQQCDNPSHGVMIKCLNNSLISASNDLLMNERMAYNGKKVNKYQNSFTSSTFQDSTVQVLKQNKPQQIKIQKRDNQQSRRCSIDYSFLAQPTMMNSGNWGNLFFLPNDKNEPVDSFKNFIMSDNKLFESYSRAQIKLQDFIKLKKAPIRKYYKLEEKIGQGSYGNVYKATCIKTKDVRAIKSIKQKMMPEDKQKEFISQIEILRELDHPNIIKLYQVYQEKTMYHVVTEYCIGGSIIDFVLARKKYSQKIVRTILQQLLSAINYIHGLGIVHRDLKLQNLVFLNMVNQNSLSKDIDVKLIDFGTAKRITQKITQCKGLVGTTSYMAPQIIDNYFNEKCDVWSAGVILYVLLMGRSPFKCSTKEETLKKIKNHELEFDEPEWGCYSKHVVELLQRMLIKDPQKRISASQALRHRWFKQVKSGKNLLLQNKNLVSNLSKYYRGNNLISRIQSYLTFAKVSQQQRKKISQMFCYLDKNNDGTIEVEELRVAYNQVHDEENVEELEYIVSKIDKNKSGKIDLSQFTAAIYDRRKLFVKEYLEEAFDYFDSDGTGFLQHKEMQELLEGCEKKEIQEILLEIDANGDERISKEEFLDYLLKRNFLFTNNVGNVKECERKK